MSSALPPLPLLHISTLLLLAMYAKRLEATSESTACCQRPLLSNMPRRRRRVIFNGRNRTEKNPVTLFVAKSGSGDVRSCKGDGEGRGGGGREPPGFCSRHNGQACKGLSARRETFAVEYEVVCPLGTCYPGKRFHPGQESGEKRKKKGKSATAARARALGCFSFSPSNAPSPAPRRVSV